MKRLFATLLAALLASAAAPVRADKHHKHDVASAELTGGEIRRVDKDAKKLTIRHEPIPSLDMPAMTMVFQVKDPAILEQVKAGDKVMFQAEKLGGAFTVTRIEQAK